MTSIEKGIIYFSASQSICECNHTMIVLLAVHGDNILQKGRTAVSVSHYFFAIIYVEFIFS